MSKEQDIELDLYGMTLEQFRDMLTKFRGDWREGLLKGKSTPDMDWELFEQLCLRGVPAEHICYIFCRTEMELDALVKARYSGIDFGSYLATARAMMLAIIRNSQLTRNDTQMLKHLGEWYLDQKDKAGEERLIKDLQITIVVRTPEDLDEIDLSREGIW